MHDTAMEIGCLVMDRYSDLAQAKVLELGSYDVNGSLRTHTPESTEYVGLDLEAGPGVDIVVEPGKPWPLPDSYFDLVLASSVFEHDPMFWITFLEMVKKTRNGGYIYICAPSNGSIHRYPQDHWRFYPDSGLALVRWAESQGQPVRLIESFTAGRKGEQWNDFVAIFRKGLSKKGIPNEFVYQQVASFNVFTWESKEMINPTTLTEDMLIIEEARAKLKELDEQLAQTRLENQTNWDERQNATHQLLLLQSRLDQEQAGHAAARTQLAEMGASLERHRSDAEIAEARVAEIQERINGYENEKGELTQRLAQQVSAAEEALARVAESEARLRELEERNEQLRADNDEQRIALESAAYMRDQLAVAKSTLLQRQEEIDQTWAELIGLKSVYEALVTERDTLASRLEESESWVFRLAAERKSWEVEAERANRNLAKVQEDARIEASKLSNKLEMLEAEYREVASRAEQADHIRSDHAAEIARLKQQLADAGKYERLASEASQRLASLESDCENLRIEQERVTRQATERSWEIVTLTHLLDEASERLAYAEGERERLSSDLEHTKREASKQLSEIVALKSRLHEAEKFEQVAAAANARVKSIERERDAIQSELGNMTRQSAERLSDIVALTRVLEASRIEIETNQKNVAWLREVSYAVQSAPSWWSFLPRKQKRKRELDRLKRRGIFDWSEYLSRYPDVAEDGIDPLDHFIIHGINEGRDL